jgi:hypothetical protein
MRYSILDRFFIAVASPKQKHKEQSCIDTKHAYMFDNSQRTSSKLDLALLQHNSMSSLCVLFSLIYKINII